MRLCTSKTAFNAQINIKRHYLIKSYWLHSKKNYFWYKLNEDCERSLKGINTIAQIYIRFYFQVKIHPSTLMCDIKIQKFKKCTYRFDASLYQGPSKSWIGRLNFKNSSSSKMYFKSVHLRGWQISNEILFLKTSTLLSPTLTKLLLQDFFFPLHHLYKINEGNFLLLCHSKIVLSDITI